MMPNVIFVVLDSIRADHLSCYGYEKRTSPFIDSLAARGTMFRNAISPGGGTIVSHRAIFTGLYPEQLGFGSWLDERYESIASLLKKNGYQTVGFCTNPWVSSATGLDRGFDDFLFFNARNFYRVVPPTSVAKYLTGFRRHSAATLFLRDLAAHWVRRRAKDGPFFMFLHFDGTHHPYNPPPRFVREQCGSNVNAELLRRLQKEDYHDLVVNGTVSESGVVDAIKVLYDGEIAYHDDVLMSLFDRWSSYIDMDNCIFIITADHGDNLGERGFLGHMCSLYDEILRVPFVVHAPKYIPSCSFDGLVSTHDIKRTLEVALGLDGAYLDNAPAGTSLVEMIGGKKKREYVVSQMRYFPNQRITKWHLQTRYPGVDLEKDDFCNVINSIRTNSWKLIKSSVGMHELYDLEKDPLEANNVYGRNADLRVAAEKMYESWLTVARTTSSGDEEATFSESMVEQLRQLGYVD